MENTEFIIPLNGLALGKSSFSMSVGKKFFEDFGNEEVIDAELDALVEVEKSGHYIGIDCELKGNIVVACDRCLAELQIPINPIIKLSIKYGLTEDEDCNEGEREVICLSSDQADFDMSQIIYDYACLALPMQRVHKDGDCDPQVIEHLGFQQVSAEPESMEANNPFGKLKNLFDN